MGIPAAYTEWILRWLEGRRGSIEIGNCRSDWFRISKGGPQGGILTPTVFMSYHADIPQFLSYVSSHFFADNIGSKYSTQCLDLERSTKIFFDQLEDYCTLANQPVNYSKTVALWSARVIGGPDFVIDHKDRSINWSKGFRYLGYEICPKLGWSKNDLLNEV
jgi:hypothetical protein